MKRKTLVVAALVAAITAMPAYAEEVTESNLSQEECIDGVSETEVESETIEEIIEADLSQEVELNETFETEEEAENALSSFEEENANVEGEVIENTYDDISEDIENVTQEEIEETVTELEANGYTAEVDVTVDISSVEETVETKEEAEELKESLEEESYTVEIEEVRDETEDTTTEYSYNDGEVFETKEEAEAVVEEITTEFVSAEVTPVTEEVTNENIITEKFDTEDAAKEYGDSLLQEDGKTPVEYEIQEKKYVNSYDPNNGSTKNSGKKSNTNLFIRIDNKVQKEDGTTHYDTKKYTYVGSAYLDGFVTGNTSVDTDNLAELVKLNDSIGNHVTGLNMNSLNAGLSSANITLAKDDVIVWYVSKVEKDYAVNGKPACDYHLDGVIRKNSEVTDIKYFVVYTEIEKALLVNGYTVEVTEVTPGYDYKISAEKELNTYSGSIAATRPNDYTAVAKGNPYKITKVTIPVINDDVIENPVPPVIDEIIPVTPPTVEEKKEEIIEVNPPTEVKEEVATPSPTIEKVETVEEVKTHASHGGGGGSSSTVAVKSNKRASATIIDEETPLASLPEVEIPITVLGIQDEEVPLAALPQTGKTNPLWIALIGLISISYGFITRMEKRKIL